MRRSLQHFVIDAARDHGARLAVAAGPEGADSLTYGLLDRRANIVAHRLRGLGVGRGDRVVIRAEKTTAAVVAMQAVLRLGAAYVPVDPATPPERAALVARDCAARVVVEEDLAAGTDTDTGPGTDTDASPVDTPVAPDDLAYILYTSGSTGAPKGVCVSHRSARAFVEWARAEVAARPEDRFANHASFSFDLSVFDLYVAFAAGASVHLVPRESSDVAERLVEFLHERRISVWYSVPSALSLAMRHGGLLDRPPPPALRAVLFAGEVFPVGDVRRLASWTEAALFNFYGPTETNVCTHRRVTAADLARDRPVPIGGPSCGSRVWAVRDDGEICGPGERGELVVDGPTVMLGYWGRAPHTGPYRTGDLVTVLPDGTFDYLGRRDGMVKVRGHRVELGEVESALTTHPDVAEAVALVVGSGLDARLVSYLVPETGRTPGVVSVRRHIAPRLPRHALPDDVRFVPTLPRTSNGKVDRHGLEEVRQ